MIRIALICFVTFLSAGCAGRGELRHHHRLQPPSTAEAGELRVRVERVAGLNLPGARHAAVPRLWIEVKLDNHGAAPWTVRASDLRLVPSETEAAGFRRRPNVLPDAPLRAEIAVGAGETRRVWVRFDDVRPQHAIAARAGVDVPASLALLVRVPGNQLRLALSDPERGEPLWSAPKWPYFATLSFGTGLVAGRNEVLDEPQAAMSLDVSLSAHRRFGEFDIGLVGALRGGLEAHPIEDGAYSFLGGGVTMGYTFHLADIIYVRPAASLLVGRTGHPVVETTPAWLYGELQFGIPRRSTYPYRERPTNFTLGWYLRGETLMHSFSAAEEPHTLGMSVGLVMRGGS